MKRCIVIALSLAASVARRPQGEAIPLSRQSGFTLLEVMIAVVVATLIAAAMLPNYPEMVNQKRADITVARMLVLSEAAQAFITDASPPAWPDQANNCADALNVLDAGGYIAGMGPVSPWQTNYAFTCPGGAAGAFNIAVGSVLEDWAQYMSNSLPASTMSASAGAPPTRTVTGSFPRPATLSGAGAPNLNDVLWRTDQSGGTNPERNRMDTAIDMNNQNINNTNEIEWANSKLTNQGGGSIELGSQTGGPGTGNPRIDFHVAGGVAGSPQGDLRIIASRDALSGMTLMDFVGDMVRAKDLVVTDAGNHRISEGVYEVALVAPEEVITKPTCGAGLTPRIYMALTEFAESDEVESADEILGIRVEALDAPAGAWTARFYVTTFTGTIHSGQAVPFADAAPVNKAIAIVKCGV